MTARVSIRLKAAILDPQGKTVLNAARQLGFDEIENVRIGKLIEISLKPEADLSVMQQRIDELSRKLLANPLVETYEVLFVDEENR